MSSISPMLLRRSITVTKSAIKRVKMSAEQSSASSENEVNIVMWFKVNSRAMSGNSQVKAKTWTSSAFSQYQALQSCSLTVISNTAVACSWTKLCSFRTRRRNSKAASASRAARLRFRVMSSRTFTAWRLYYVVVVDRWRLKRNKVRAAIDDVGRTVCGCMTSRTFCA